MRHLTAFLLLLLNYQASVAGNYFVAAGGSNSNSGTVNAPYATIQFALNQAQAGDTVQVRGGTYTEKLIWVRSGTSAQWITLKAYQSEPVIVTGTGLTALEALFIDNKSYAQVEGIIFQDNYRQDARGIYITGEGSNITISKCTVRNMGWTTNPNADPYSANPQGQAHGILVIGRTATGFSNIKILDCKVNDIICGNSEAVTVSGNVNGFEILRDTVFNNKNIGIVAAGFYTTGAPANVNQARNGTISNCIAYNNRRFSNLYAPAGIYSDGAKDLKIINNRSYNNGNGISVGAETGPAHTSSGIVVMNNIVYGNDNAGVVFGTNEATNMVQHSTIINNTLYRNGLIGTNGQEITLQRIDSCIIANNIIIPITNLKHGIAAFGATVSHLTVHRNLFYRDPSNDYIAPIYVSSPAGQFTPLDTIFNYPAFLDSNRTNLNLNININSPCINAGSNLYPQGIETDVAGNFRYVNGTIDIGAYERQDGGCPQIFRVNNVQAFKGKLVASQQIIIDVPQPLQVQTEMRWSSPNVLIKTAVTAGSKVTVAAGGCN